MAYRIAGLDPIALGSADALLASGARRVVATAPTGFPCRVTLEDAAVGEPLLLFHYVSHDVATPYRSAYAIYVRESALAGEASAPVHHDAPPPLMAKRTLGLRGFDAEGMLRSARVAMPGEADADLRALFAMPEIAYVDCHHAAAGCFLARAERAGHA